MNSYSFIILFITVNFLCILYFEKLKFIIPIKDYPSKRKLHKSPVPLLGGPILFLNLSFYILLVNFEFIENTSIIDLNIFYLFCVIIFLIGIIDDVYSISPNKKLVMFLIVFISYCYLEQSILIDNIYFEFKSSNISIGNYNFFFTVFCFIVFVNAFNMFDGINLQSATYSIFLSANLYYFNGNIFFLMLIVFFIFFSFLNYKGRSFLGNSGSYLVPFIFSVMFIISHNFENFKADLIFTLMAIPGLELIRITIYRILNGNHPFFPDKNHIHHLMIKKFSLEKTLIFLNLLILLELILYFFFKDSLLSILLIISTYFITIFILIKSKK